MCHILARRCFHSILARSSSLTVVDRQRLAISSRCWSYSSHCGYSSFAQQCQRLLSVSPGCGLHVEFPDGKVHVDIATGDHETIAIQVENFGSHESELAIQNDNNNVHVGGTSSCLQDARLRIWVPQRFCSIEVLTQGGDVSIETVNEGAMKVQSGGGDIAMGKIKATDAYVDSGGGHVCGSVTGGTIRLTTGGGNATLQRLVGQEVQLTCASGECDVEVAYTDHLNLQSGGGSIRVGMMNCRVSGSVCSSGGDVTLGGMDGHANINSAGGNVQVQLADQLRDLSISSDGGDVVLHASPNLTTLINCKGASLQIDQQIDVKGSDSEISSCVGGSCKGILFGSQVGSSRMVLYPTQQQMCPLVKGDWTTAGKETDEIQRSVVVDATDKGVITLRARNWLEAMQAKWKVQGVLK